MEISVKNVINSYQTLKQASVNKEENAEIEICLMPVDIISSSVDNDKSTKDNIVASHWNGCGSSPVEILTFTETMEQDKQILVFEKTIPTSPEVSMVKIDEETQKILEQKGNIKFIDSVVSPEPVTTGLSPSDAKGKTILAEYERLQKAIASGEALNRDGVFEYMEIELIEKKDNILKVSEWNGCFSSAASIVTYENGTKDGKEVLYYTKETPLDGEIKKEAYTVNLATGLML